MFRTTVQTIFVALAAGLVYLKSAPLRWRIGTPI